MKKIRMSRELAYVIGIVSMPFAVACTIKSNLGTSMIVAPAYIISEKVSFLTQGQTEYIIQTLFIILMSIILKRFRPAYLMAFASAFIYGTILDFANWVCKSNEVPDSMVLRVILLAVGMIATSFSVAMFFKTYLAPCAYDYFVAKIGAEKKLNMRIWKLSFDLSMLTISIILSFLLFKRLIGVNIGTVIMTALNGNIIAAFTKFFYKHIEFFNRSEKLSAKFD